MRTLRVVLSFCGSSLAPETVIFRRISPNFWQFSWGKESAAKKWRSRDKSDTLTENAAAERGADETIRTRKVARVAFGQSFSPGTVIFFGNSSFFRRFWEKKFAVKYLRRSSDHWCPSTHFQEIYPSDMFSHLCGSTVRCWEHLEKGPFQNQVKPPKKCIISMILSKV